MDQPPGFQDAQYPHHVCKLRKSLYGLKQAPREWFQKLTRQFLQLGFQGSKTDTSLYFTHTGPIYLLIYVDDILILSIEFQSHQDGYLLTQTQYTISILRLLKMENCKCLSTPCPLSCSAVSNKNTNDSHLYRRIVGALQYLNFTLPDISYAVNQACRSMHSPQPTDWIRLKDLLRYLKGTITHGLYFNRLPANSITSFSDADWAGDVSDRRSTSGFLVYLGDNLVSWSSKKQPIVARSSTEA